MSSITINSNLAALNTQRRLGQSTSALQQSFTRLSSGLRINRASDDASGLAISSELNLDARVFNQGVRNLNDAVGLLNVAEGAVRELSGIVIRIRELATQASNGTLALEQRQALHEEANALVDEFNRVVEVTEYNDRALLDTSFLETRAQGGYGSDGGILFLLAEELSRIVGTGTFTVDDPILTSGGFAPSDEAVGDVNGDGIADIVVGSTSAKSVSIRLGNGDGSFGASQTLTIHEETNEVELADFNGDGALDVAFTLDSDSFGVLLGNGDGSFEAGRYTTTAKAYGDFQVGDFNNDGIADIALSSAPGDTSTMIALISDGDGTFTQAQTFTGFTDVAKLEAGDLDGDGNLDLVVASRYGRYLQVFMGNGDGTFAVGFDDSGGNDWASVVADVNGDAILDIVYNSDTTLVTLLGNGDGSFQAAVSQSLGTSVPDYLVASDIDGDGNLDLLMNDQNGGYLLTILGNGDGTFQELEKSEDRVSIGATFADINGDGVFDVVGVDYTVDEIRIAFGDTTSKSTLPTLNILNQENALATLDFIDETLTRVSSELGAIGATQSRLQTAISNLQQSRENYLSAASEITDVDVAKETAELTKARILQQAGAAVLAQANQSPALALSLLGGI